MNTCYACGAETETDLCHECLVKQQDLRWKNMGLRKLWRRLTWDDFVQEEDQRAVIKCREYAGGWPQTRGLIISSPNPGNGKTLLAACILKDVSDGFFVNCAELLFDIKASFDGKGRGLFDKAMRAPLLVLDDMGADRHTEWTVEMFYILINAKVEDEAPVIVTTNLEDRSALESCYGRRTMDRLVGSSDVIRLRGDSFRMKGKT